MSKNLIKKVLIANRFSKIGSGGTREIFLKGDTVELTAAQFEAFKDQFADIPAKVEVVKESDESGESDESDKDNKADKPAVATNTSKGGAKA